MPVWVRRAGIGPRWQTLALGLVVAVALLLRLSNLNWDSGHLFHPDERHILMVTEGLSLPWPLDPKVLLDRTSPLNPKSFAYGSLIFYLLKAAQWAVNWLTTALQLSPNELWLQGGVASLRYVGRALSALFDTGTVVLTFVVARRLYGRTVGLLAAVLIAFSVLNIQLSHFYASDTPMTFFVTLTLLFCVRIVQGGGRGAGVGAAVAAGLAMACKVSAAPILAAVAIAYVLREAVPSEEDVLAGEPRGLVWPSGEALMRATAAFSLGLVVTAIVFVVLQPYVVIDSRTFFANVGEQNNMVRGVADLPYTRQYINRPAYWYFIENLALFGEGLPLGAAMVVGTLFAVVRAIRAPRRSDLLLLSFLLPYFAITGSFHAKFLRYMLPIVPVLTILAALALVELVRWASRRVGRVRTAGVELDGATELTVPAPRPLHWPRRLALGLVGLVVLATVWYGIAYQAIYQGEHPAVAASRWIYANVPRGSTLANEHWEEGMPVAVQVPGPGGERRQLDPGQFGLRQTPLNLYEPDDERKLQHIAQTLARTDYILFFSNRLYGTIPRLPERYPLTTRYYELLFGEQLGFELVADFTKYPQLFGVALVDDTLSDPRLTTPRLLEIDRPAPVTINLGRADEAFSVYDHPKVLIFKKMQPLTEADVRATLGPALANVQRSTAPRAETASAPVYRSLLLAPEQALRDRLGGTYRTLFDRDGLVNRLPLLVWVIMLAIIGLAATPLAALAFPALPDSGLPLARTLGILLMTWLTWMLVSVGGLSATRTVALVGLVLVIAVGALLARRAIGQLGHLWREHRAATIAGELAFWVPFAYFALVRYINPDLWHPARGGEKPMDVAYLMAAIKSTTYPPYDPWFAGGFLNYYYFGQIIVGNLIKVAGVVPTTAYNLAVPTLYALTFAGAYSVAFNLCRRGGLAADRWAILGGAAAGVFVTTLGNLGGAGQLVDGVSRLAGVTYQSVVPGLQYLVLAPLGVLNIAFGQPLAIPTDWYWASTRILQGTINEFPYFTFLYADLHAHMIGLPFTLLAMAMALHLVLARAPRTSIVPFAEARLGFAAPAAIPRPTVPLPYLVASTRAAASSLVEDAVRLFLVGLAVGALLPINSWDFPTYLGLVAACGMASWYFAPRRTLNGFLAAAMRVGTLLALSYVLYLPFHQSFVSFYSGVKPTPEHSDLGGYLVIHGFFLAVLVSYVVRDIALGMRATGVWRTTRALGRFWERFPHMLELRRGIVTRDDGSAALVMFGVTGLLAVAAVGYIAGYTVAGVLLALLLPTVWRLLTRPRSPESAFVLLLFATGLALGITSEIVAIDGDIGRMNTVFKFYLQVWVMWGVASAAALVSMRGALARVGRSRWTRWWAVPIVALFLASAVYPIVATRARVADRFDVTIPPTFDGTAYMETATYREDARETVKPSVIRLATDRDAIEWIWDNIDGSPVIAEANTPLYRWGSRISIYTGLPTIIGWDWHQTQQRFGFRTMIDERLRDVRTLFSDRGRDRAIEILRRYNVSYIYVGQLERAYYPADGLKKFDDMVGTDLTLVYDMNEVRIYQVNEASR